MYFLVARLAQSHAVRYFGNTAIGPPLDVVCFPVLTERHTAFLTLAIGDDVQVAFLGMTKKPVQTCDHFTNAAG